MEMNLYVFPYQLVLMNQHKAISFFIGNMVNLCSNGNKITKRIAIRAGY